jgi:hypothetical protein
MAAYGENLMATHKMPDSRDFTQADARTRTGDPFITSEVLYQLSYVGVAGLSWICRVGTAIGAATVQQILFDRWCAQA